DCNREMVDLEAVETEDDIAGLRDLIVQHRDLTASPVADRILADWDACRPRFVKVMPVEYKRALEKLAAEQA
nr:hypothetical protein [Desulfobacterales bacterium]